MQHSDVLIVGAGSAGSILAERLSADANCRVTVVEAGPGVSESGVAALIADGSVLPIGSGSPLVQRYQADLTANPHRRTQIVRAKVVGGGGAVNGGYFCFGLPRDFDGWRLPGWAWPDVSPHFTDIGRAIPVRRTSEMSYPSGEFVQRAMKSGFGWVEDFNGCTTADDVLVGVGAVPLNIKDGKRAGPGAVVLQPAVGRPNLSLFTRTRVRRVHIASGRATGVEAIGPDGRAEFIADRVVLCAGGIESAHLLMVSGIGDPEMLRQAGIHVITPLPVGMQCVDHPEWVMSTSWVTTPGRPVLEAMLVTEDDIEIRPYTGGFVAMVGHGTTGRPDWPHVGVALMQPRARGRITVTSPDVEVPPRIEFHYDSEPNDLAALQRGVAIARELCPKQPPAGVPLWSTSQHLCASAPMGLDDDNRAVLDPQCGVRGVSGLWVVDGAALPAITSRGPHATIVMLAHRAAGFVAAD